MKKIGFSKNWIILNLAALVFIIKDLSLREIRYFPTGVNFYRKSKYLLDSWLQCGWSKMKFCSGLCRWFLKEMSSHKLRTKLKWVGWKETQKIYFCVYWHFFRTAVLFSFLFSQFCHCFYASRNYDKIQADLSKTFTRDS